MLIKDLPQAPLRLRKIAAKMDLSQPQLRGNLPQAGNGKARDFAEAMRLEMKAGVNAQEAIRLAQKKYPALYRTYQHELRNPPMTGPKPEDKAPKPAGGTTGESLGKAIRKAVKSGASADDALDRAVKENPGAYRDYLRTLQPPEGC